MESRLVPLRIGKAAIGSCEFGEGVATTNGREWGKPLWMGGGRFAGLFPGR